MSSNSSSRPPTLVLLPNWLGDLVMCLPAMAALRRRGPLHAVGARPLLALLEESGLVDASTPFDRRGEEAGWRGLIQCGARLRECGANEIYVFPPSLRGALLAWMSRVRRRVGFGGEGRGIFLNDVRPGPVRTRPLVEQWAEFVGAAESSLARPTLTPGADATARWDVLREQLVPGGRPYFVLAPGATYGPTKRWPEAHFVELATRIHERTHWVPLTVGSAEPQEKALCESVALVAGGASSAGRTDLSCLAALLAGAEAFVGNDSGPMHLAAAVGTTTVGIFGSSSPRWTAPRGEDAVAVGPQPVECSPCFKPSCGIGIVCLTELSIETVQAALEARLKARSAEGFA
jgi:heptosyltransferase-2